ncbi:MAG TPA: type II and III secretion system protein family protein [Tepidisphaeraceae bacterium]|jgi:pilus assembly protein CpaC
MNTKHTSIKLAAGLAAALLTASVAVGQPAVNPAGQDVAVANTAVPAVTSLVDGGLDATGRLDMAMNKTAVVTTKTKYKRFSVGQPDVADVTAVGPTTLLVTAKKAGSTQIIVWDESEQSQVIDVNVTFDVAMIRDEFKRQFPDAPITVDLLNGQIALKGRVGSLKVAEQAERVAKSFTPGVMNFLEVGGGQQIVLRVQFIEMSRSASNELGFRSFFTDGQSQFGTINGPGGAPIGGVAVGPEATIGSGITLFGGGTIGGTAFEAFLSALRTNSLARTLAEPNLVAVSGEDADFLAGGEYPYPVPQAGVGGGSTITIQYKEFGVRLRYNAVVLGDGRIRMKIMPEVSDLDYGASTSIDGIQVPGLRTRKVNTTVEMAEGQTLALAGLLQRRVDTSRSGTPLLGDLPIVGALFNTTRYTRTETELVVLVTPTLASALNPDQLPDAPGENYRYPNELKLYGLGDMGGDRGPDSEGKASVNAAPPRFVGPAGFNEGAVQPAVATVDRD